jgi:predicted metal-binding membrane protein
LSGRLGVPVRGHWLAFFALVLAAWAALFAMALHGHAGGHGAHGAHGAALWPGLPAVGPAAAGVISAVAMWALMSGAMMAPTAVPAFKTYQDLGRVTATRFGRLVAGYLAVWLGFSLLAALAQVGLQHAGLVDALGRSRSALLTAGLLLAAGLYQFSPLKEACLARCRTPLAFFLQHFEAGPWRNGLRLGLDCLGCCWALMLLAFVGGTMNLAFMGLAMVLMTLEKLPDLGRRLTRPVGVALIAGAGVSLLPAL